MASASLNPSDSPDASSSNEHRVPSLKSAASSARVSGRNPRAGTFVVVGMFFFGIILTVTMFLYWRHHRAPFLPYQKALAVQYPGSRPIVEGGKHKNSPWILRVRLQVDFGLENNPSQVPTIVETVFNLAQQHQPDLAKYDEFQVHFEYRPPERKAEYLEVKRDVSLMNARTQ